MKLSALAKIINGSFVGNDVEFNQISIDSRVIHANDCFIAIKGDVFDGHDYIADVAAKNVAVVVVDRDVDTSIPVIKVKNTRQALKDIAHFYRENAHIPVVGITGSCGKTTTRALLENILKQHSAVLASQKSFNNDIGLPLTLLQLKPSHEYLVLEIGTNHPGEIAALTDIARPTVSVITMVGPVHIEAFGSVENIAIEKGAIYAGLTPEGIAVMNADDPFVTTWKKAVKNRVITFGIEKNADVMAKDITIANNGETTFTLVFPDQSIDIHLPLLGEHNVANALAAACCAFALQIPLNAIKKGLETVQPEYGRLIEKEGFLGATILDDSYNANPASVKAAIQLITHRSQHAILVLGDMKELGDHAAQMHAEIGAYAKSAGIKKIFCLGELSLQTAKAFGDNAQHFDDHGSLIESLKAAMSSHDIVLVKGSRSMKMETVVKALL
jgi:UDP-N-acetylmuramoyl-tripeptide--D-alanyl-D-alanine ligase